ncbi:MAG: sugar ABC transporter permease [Bacteroidia bacterium]
MQEKINLRPFIMLGALIMIWIIFSFTTDGVFLNARNFSNLMRQTSIVGILATGMVLVIVAGHIDLSVGSMVALTGGIAAIANVWGDYSSPLSILIALLAGMLLGTVNGYLIAYQNIPAFIVTLGGMLVYRGAVKGITKGETVGPLKENFQGIGSSFLPQYIAYGMMVIGIIAIVFWLVNQLKTVKAEGGRTIIPIITSTVLAVAIVAFFLMLIQYKGVPNQVLIMLTIAGIVTFVAMLTPFGRYVYAIGGNKEAAFYSGISIRTNLFFVYIIMGLLAAVAGIVYTAQLGNATANAGRNLELDAIAACVIGGTSLLGGKGSIPGALLGALVMASLDNGMSLMNIQDFIQDIIKGIILVTAVWLDVSGGKKN